jgi:thioesterase domain-containing protein
MLPWTAVGNEPTTSLEAMAARMVPVMQEIQPRGPYRLAGYSLGGVLAYAIAQHLLSIDETVSFVGLIDVALPAGEQRTTPATKRRYSTPLASNSITSAPISMNRHGPPAGIGCSGSLAQRSPSSRAP